jgi:seryl-tRNA synthetase
MLEQIEKLKIEKQKLTTEYKQASAEYKAEIKKIDKALNKFRQGVEALSDESPAKQEKQTATTEIEKILKEFGASKVKDITHQLHQRGFQTTEQTVSGILQRCVKAGKRFTKVGAATYALLEKTESTLDNQAGGDDELEQIF